MRSKLAVIAAGLLAAAEPRGVEGPRHVEVEGLLPAAVEARVKRAQDAAAVDPQHVEPVPEAHRFSPCSTSSWILELVGPLCPWYLPA